MACPALVDRHLFLVPPERVVESAALLNTVVSPARISVSRLLDQLTASAFVEKTFESRVPLMAI
jgi:hypothetical protein